MPCTTLIFDFKQYTVVVLAQTFIIREEKGSIDDEGKMFTLTVACLFEELSSVTCLRSLGLC